MITKLKLALEQANETVCISNTEAAKIFKALLATGDLLDDINESLVDADGNVLTVLIDSDKLRSVEKAWEELGE